MSRIKDTCRFKVLRTALGQKMVTSFCAGYTSGIQAKQGLLKGTVARDLLASVFFMNLLYMRS